MTTTRTGDLVELRLAVVDTQGRRHDVRVQASPELSAGGRRGRAVNSAITRLNAT